MPIEAAIREPYAGARLPPPGMQNLTLPETLLERVFFWGLQLPFLLYFGGLAPIGPLLVAWAVILIGLFTIVRDGVQPHWLTMLWFACMCAVLVQILVFFSTRNVGGWYIPHWGFTFALAAFLPMVGMLVRPQVVYCAAALLGVQVLLYCIAAPLAIKAGIEPGYESLIPKTRLFDEPHYKVRLTQEKELQGPETRLVAFTPYPTAAGAVACFFALFTLGAGNSLLKWGGFAGWLSLVAMARVRTGLICLSVGVALYFLLQLPRRYLLLVAGLAALALAAFAGQLLPMAQDLDSYIRAQRSVSSEDRTNLRVLAYEEWLHGGNPLLGAGASVPGGAIVAHVAIGTHDTLAANLFLRGVMGFGLTLLPVMVTFLLGFFAGFLPRQRIATCAAVMLLIYTYSQELNELYIYIWPVFLVIGGMCFQERAPRIAAPAPAPALAT